MFESDSFWLLIKIVILIISIIIHEIFHGWVAFRLGDPSAKYAGRLTFNPFSHLDPIGSFFLPLLLVLTGAPVLFGWAKPVPYNPNNLKNPKRDSLLVALSGPFSNFLLALMAAFLFHVLKNFYNFFSLRLLLFILVVNVALFVFNLLPIPPLDGSKIVAYLLPFPYSAYWENLEPYGFLILFLFLFTPAFNNFLSFLIFSIMRVFGIFTFF